MLTILDPFSSLCNAFSERSECFLSLLQQLYETGSQQGDSQFIAGYTEAMEMSKANIYKSLKSQESLAEV